MARWLSLFLLLALLLRGGEGEGGEEECEEESCVEEGSAVLRLNDSNFGKAVEGKELVVVLFHAPWCHHCHTYLNDVFAPVATQLAQEGTTMATITMATVDIEEAEEVKNRFTIQEVPAVKLFRNGMVFPYQGPAQHLGAPALLQYLREEMNRATSMVEDPVLTLTTDNFDDIISTSDLILVEFYTDMCLPCQQLEPHYTAAARRLLRNTPPVPLGRVQIPDQIEVAKRFPLEGYPLLMMFRHGQQYNYTGPKNQDGIVQYMQRQAGPGSIPVERYEDMKKFIDSREPTVVGYFDEETDSSLVAEFIESGYLVRTDMRLRHTYKLGVAERMGQSPGTIVVYHPVHLVTKYEDGYSIINSPPTNATQLRLLYLEHARPLVGQMTRQNYGTTFRPRPLLLAYLDLDWSHDGFKATKYWHNLIASVANQFCDSNITFAVANEQDYPNDLRSVGLGEWSEEVAVAIFAPGPLKYPMREELTQQSLGEFIESYLDGQLHPYFSSEPVPRPEKGALIRKIVGTTLQKEVLSPLRNALLLLCSPSLPSCRDSHTHLSSVASKFKGTSDLLFGEMNIELNDPPPGTPVGPLPAFLFSPKGSEGMFPMTPSPQDEADLVFFLKRKQNIQPPVGSKVNKGKKGKKRKVEL